MTNVKWEKVKRNIICFLYFAIQWYVVYENYNILTKEEKDGIKECEILLTKILGGKY